MGFFDGTGFGMDPTTLTLASLAQAAAQTAMPSRLPVPTGAVFGNLAGGLVNAANTNVDMDTKRATSELTRAKIPHLQMQTTAGAAAMKALQDWLGKYQSGRRVDPHAPQISPSAGGGGDTVVPDGASVFGSLSGGGADALVRKYESEGLAKQLGMSPYSIGVGGTDLSNAPKDEYGFPQWAGKQGPAGLSHAAGAYQFQPGTWRQYAAPLGIKDFSKDSQDKVFAAAHADQGFKPWAPYNPRLAAALMSEAGGSTPQPQGQALQRPVQLAQNGPMTSLPANVGGAGPAGPMDVEARYNDAIRRGDTVRAQQILRGEPPSPAPQAMSVPPPAPIAPPSPPQMPPRLAPAGPPPPGPLAPPPMQAAQAGPPQMQSQRVQMPGALAPPQSASPGPGGIDPMELAIMGSLGELGGLTNFTKPIADAYYNSHDYKAGLERALIGPRLEQKKGEADIDLRNAGPMATAKSDAEARSAYLRPENQPAVVQALAAAKTQGDREAILRSMGLTPGSPEANEISRRANPGSEPTPDTKNFEYARGTPGFENYQLQQKRAAAPPNIGTIPEGMQLVPTPEGGYRMEPVPGGKIDMAQKNAAISTQKAGTIVTQDIDRALPMVGAWTAGPIGALTKGLPGSQSHDLDQILLGIGANTSLDRLQEMRQGSATGGALGNVTEGEHKILRSVYGSIEQSQTPGQLKYNLLRLRDVYLDTVNGSPERLETLVRAGKLTSEQAASALSKRMEGLPSGGAPADAPSNTGVTPLGNTWKVK